MTTRREFLAGSVGLAATAIAWPAAAAPAAYPIVDTHTHFYDPERPQGVPWPGKDDKSLYRRVLPEHFAAFAKPLGVTGTVVVEASSWVEDNQWVLDLAAKDPFVLGLVGNLTPGKAEFAGHLKRFAGNPKFRGIRVNSGSLKAGLDPKIADELALRKRPANMKEDEAAVYDFCIELHEKKSVSDAAYAAALKMFGEQGIVDLIGASGYYTMVSMILNVDRHPLPEGVTPLPEIK